MSTLPRVLAQDLRKTGCIKEKVNSPTYYCNFSRFSLVQGELFLRVHIFCKKDTREEQKEKCHPGKYETSGSDGSGNRTSVVRHCG